MPKKIKLTDRQWEVVELMRDGWGMVIDSTLFSGLCSLIKSGAGWKDVNANTFHGLYKKGIVTENTFPSSIWQLTELGKTLKREGGTNA